MTREDIMSALFALIKGAADFKRTGRRLQLWTDVAPADKPAMFMSEHDEDSVNPDDSTPGKLTINAKIWIYTDAGLDQSVEPIIELNNLIDSVWKVLQPNNPVQNVFYIPGTPARVRIDGKVIKDAGDIDGNGLAIIPLKILVPSF